jgi:hypothetical protein
LPKNVNCSDDEVCTLVSVHGTEACGERSAPYLGTEWWRVVSVAVRPLYLGGGKLPVPFVRCVSG